MRMWASLVALVVAMVPHLLVAQSASIRPRISILVPASVPELEAPALAITVPTSAASYTTPDSVVAVGGTVGDTVYGDMSWSSNRGSSGTMTPAGGLWSITTSGAATDVFVETFDSTVSDNLTGHTVTPGPGSSWATALAGSGTNYCNIRSADYVQPALGSEAARLMCRSVTAGALSANYDVSFRLVSSMPTSAHPNRQYGVYFSSQQTSNPTDFCAVTVGNAAGSTDLRLSTSVTSTGTVVASADANPVVGNLVTVHVRGANVSVDLDGVEKIPATSIAACNGASRSAGLIFGAMISESDNITDPTARIDDYTLVDVSTGTAGVPVLSGANIITVQACNVASSCTTKTITINSGTDTQAPTLSLSQPTAGTPYSTTAATVTLQGLTTDTVGVGSVICTNLSDMVAYTGTIVGDVWTCTDVAVGLGVQDVEYEACDAATNCTTLTVEVTRTAAGDTTDPTTTISTASQTVTSPSIVLVGTSTDNAAVDHVSCAGDVSAGGTATGTPGASMAWSLSLDGTLALGANVFTCTAYDTSGNADETPATVTITYTPVLSVSSSTLPSAVQNVAYVQQTITATGGTPPYTWDNGSALGTSLGGGNCSTGTITDSGDVALVNGTFTTTPPVTCTFTARVTDNLGATASRSFSISIVAASTLGNTDHSYYDSMCARADKYRCYSLRKVGTADPDDLNQLIINNNDHPDQLWSYSPSTDTHSERQDALKMLIRQFNPTAARVAVAMGAPAAGTFETIELTASASAENGSGIKIGNEVMVCMPDTLSYQLPNGAVGQCATTTAPYRIRVMRGTYGTTPEVHAVNDLLHRSSNTMTSSNTPVLPIYTDGLTSNRYLAGIRAYFPAEWQGLGMPGGNEGLNGFTTHNRGYSVALTSMKWLTWGMGGSTKAVELRCREAGGTSGVSMPPTWVTANSVCAVDLRGYTVHWGQLVTGQLQTSVPFLGNSGVLTQPMVNTFTINPSKPVNIYWYHESNTETESAAWTDFHPLAAAITDPDATTLSIDLTGERYTISHSFTSNAPYFDGRAMKIDDEIVTLTNCTLTVTPSVCTVVRGAYGTTKATHAAGATVKFTWDCWRIYASDPDTDPTELYRVCLPNFIGSSYQGGRYNIIQDLTAEYGTSTSGLVKKRMLDGYPDLPIYLSDFFMLKKTGTAGTALSAVPADWLALMQRPTY